MPLKVGSYMFHSGGGVHYDGGGEEGAIVQVIGMGEVEQPCNDGPADRNRTCI